MIFNNIEVALNKLIFFIIVNSAGIYISFVGHAICFVPAISYINLRIKNTDTRLVKLAVPFCLHVLGIGVACVINASYVEINFLNGSYIYPKDIDLNALLSAALSALLICGFLYNICVHQRKNTYNYKMSLDYNIQREIGSNQILHYKYFSIDNSQTGYLGENSKKQIALPIYAILTTIQSIIFLYPPYHYFSYLMSLGMSTARDILYGPIFGIVGITISLILFKLLDYKKQYISVSIGQIIYFIIWIIIIAADFNYTAVQYTGYVAFGFFAMTRPHAYINITSYTSIKMTDFYVGVVYFIEMVVLGMIQYYSIYKSSVIFGPSNTLFTMIAGNAISLFVIIVILLLVGIKLLPNEKFTSLLTIKNWINDGKPLDMTTDYSQHNKSFDHMGYNVAQISVIENNYQHTGPHNESEYYDYSQRNQHSEPHNDSEYYNYSQRYHENNVRPSAPPITEL